MTEAHIVLADGTVFEARAVGAPGIATGEVVFTTGMTGYEEVLSDPSYCGQLVTMTAPQMGNTGVNGEDLEAEKPFLSGFIVHEMSRMTSNWRTQQSLPDYLKSQGIVAVDGVDTRSLTRHIRDKGAQMAAMGTGSIPELLEAAKAAPPMEGLDLSALVTTDVTYEWTEGSDDAWRVLSSEEPRPHVVAVDFGVKRNILRCLIDAGCRVTVVPSRTSAEAILALNPDGVFLSNGPGDPAAVGYGVETVRALLGKKPIFGICLGHQLLCLALGGTTYKLKFGHRGLNQPVKDLVTGSIEITTQNHGFVADIDSLKGACELTHVHLNDGTCMGIRRDEDQAFSVQYHPEAAAGPHDGQHLFGRFVSALR